MLPVSALKSMRVMFATPCYISAVTMNYVASIFSLTLRQRRISGLPCILHLHSESLITRARNKIVIKFLSEELHPLVLDRFRHRLHLAIGVSPVACADREIAAGVYPMKNFNWPAEGIPAGMTQKQFEITYTQYPFNPIDHGKTRVSPYADSEGFVEVAEAPTGFMVIKRHVFLADDEAVSRAQLRSGRAARTTRRRPCTGASSTAWSIPNSGRYLSEDYAFCRRWRDMGGKIWVDLDCKLMHLGQHLFSRRPPREPARAGPLVSA